MSSAGPTLPFNPSKEHDIPPWPRPEPAPKGPERVYVLSMRVTGGRLEFYFSERPATPDPSADKPLELRVPEDCVIVLRLDPAWNWEFRHDNAVVLGPENYKDRPRYFNLSHRIENGRCQEISFNAIFLDIEDHTNHDPYAIYVNLAQPQQADGTTTSLLLRIDPEIFNPGDRS